MHEGQKSSDADRINPHMPQVFVGFFIFFCLTVFIRSLSGSDIREGPWRKDGRKVLILQGFSDDGCVYPAGMDQVFPGT